MFPLYFKTEKLNCLINVLKSIFCCTVNTYLTYKFLGKRTITITIKWVSVNTIYYDRISSLSLQTNTYVRPAITLIINHSICLENFCYFINLFGLDYKRGWCSKTILVSVLQEFPLCKHIPLGDCSIVVGFRPRHFTLNERETTATVYRLRSRFLNFEFSDYPLYVSIYGLSNWDACHEERFS